jgi:hypothetical protein
MGVPSTDRPVLAALAAAFAKRDVWLQERVDPSARQVDGDAHYQMLAVWMGYIEKTSAGYVLTDRGRRVLDAVEAGAR